MKIKTIIMTVTNLALIIFSMTAATITNQPNVVFSWQYPTPPTNGYVFRVYGTTNLSQNITNWPQVVAWTNWGTVISGTQVFYTNSLFLTPSQYFFTMTASNTFWGESLYSTPVSVPGPASSPTNLGLIYIGQ